MLGFLLLSSLLDPPLLLVGRSARPLSWSRTCGRALRMSVLPTCTLSFGAPACISFLCIFLGIVSVHASSTSYCLSDSHVLGGRAYKFPADSLTAYCALVNRCPTDLMQRFLCTSSRALPGRLPSFCSFGASWLTSPKIDGRFVASSRVLCFPFSFSF